MRTETGKEPAKHTATVTRADVARRLWRDYIKVEYDTLSALARAEWDPETASHTPPAYLPDGSRLVGTPPAGTEIGRDKVYDTNGARDDHDAVRTYIWDSAGVGSQIVDRTRPDDAVFGSVESTGTLPKGITLVGRIMGALGYTRGVNNLGAQTYFSLQDPRGERTKNMLADAVHLDPPADTPELPKIFISQIHLSDLAKAHTQSSRHTSKRPSSRRRTR